MDQKFRGRLINLFLVALLLLGLNFFLSGQIRDLFYGQYSSIQSFSWQLANAITFSNKDQVEENKRLIEENQKILSQLAGLMAVQDDNVFLRKALNLPELKGHDFLDAEVIGGARFNGAGFDYEDTILIRKGKNDGVQKGFSVLTPDKVLIGKVMEVYDNHSRVMLVTDKDSVVDIQILREKEVEVKQSPVEVAEAPITEEGLVDGQVPVPVPLEEPIKKKTETIIDKTVAIAKGEGKLKASLDMFPKDAELNEGDLVVTSSLTGSYPAGFLVGTIKSPKKIDTEEFKEAEIVPAFDIKLLNKVLVLRDIEIINND
jgi:cell shape-determining protein MreC